MRKYRQVAHVRQETFKGGGLIIKNGRDIIWRLNRTGFMMWQALGDWTAADKLADLLEKEFAVNRETAKRDVEDFLKKGIHEKMLQVKE